MSRVNTLLSFVLLIAGLPAIASAQVIPQAVGQWEVTTSFRALDRPLQSGTNTTIFSDGGTGRTLLDSDTATDLNIGLGTDIAISSLREDGNDYEIRFFFNSFNRDTLTQADDIRSGFFTGASFREVTGNYMSDMFNIELNQKRIISPYFRALHGIRYFHLEEDFSFVGTGQTFIPAVGIVPFSGTSKTRTRNPMLGYHLGGESTIALLPGLNVDGFFKAGVFANFADQTTQVFNSVTPVQTLTNGSETALGFVCDMGSKFNFEVVDNFMSFYGGYDLMYVNNFAPAPLNVGRTSGVVNDEELWVHGVVFGFKIVR